MFGPELSTNSRKATKPLDRLTPNVAHMCRFIWEWIYANQLNLKTQGGISGGGGGLGGHKSKSLGRLSNDWTDWHQTGHTSADSSGNGHRLNTIRPSTLGGGGGVRGHKFKSQGKMSNGWSDGIKFGTHVQIHLGIDIRQTNCPETHKGHLGFRGSNIQKSGEAVKRLDRLAPTLVHVCGFIWEWE